VGGLLVILLQVRHTEHLIEEGGSKEGWTEVASCVDMGFDLVIGIGPDKLVGCMAVVGSFVGYKEDSLELHRDHFDSDVRIDKDGSNLGFALDYYHTGPIVADCDTLGLEEDILFPHSGLGVVGLHHSTVVNLVVGR
jgi:hypothetical protein